MKKVRVKEWLFDKMHADAKRYNIYMDYAKRKDDDSIGIPVDEDGYVTIFAREVLAESEKAYKFTFESGRLIGSCNGWTTWVPKSAVVIGDMTDADYESINIL